MRTPTVARYFTEIALDPLGDGAFHGDDWHHRLNRFLHSNRVHLVLNILLVVDLLLVVTGLILEVEFLKTKVEDLEHVCEIGECPVPGGTSHVDFEEQGNHDLEDAEKTLVYASVAILFLFLLENVGLILANGLYEFFSHFWHTVDLIVVVVSIVFELGPELDGVGFSVVARLWRFARIGHGVHHLEEVSESGEDSSDQRPTDSTREGEREPAAAPPAQL